MTEIKTETGYIVRDHSIIRVLQILVYEDGRLIEKKVRKYD